MLRGSAGRRKGRSAEVRAGILNEGTVTGKDRELADIMERKTVDMFARDKRKGSEAKSIRGGFYRGMDRN